ncbi:hypothetical protein LOTGIDRAFT_105441 [Lottia gigantea]|uniref:Protein kinase domain-containing protein n=1 Tax=Lottia gigantea TaxID=225164 RepID=V4A460_LOTGI|nr:hypothetical protein LOTGIDRAFT_105441 [Lottia gigantea]ESO91472.1 hypothetical protein LOTGIDRAFT_105441 [Lottia gigantea]
MTTTKGSKNYVWDTQDSLGHGATSMVYQGRCKKTFDLVAVKVFNPASYNRPISIQMREFDVMKKLNHKNIVKLLSIEEENHTYNKVIVMEYCPYGSLFSMLEEPQNAFGIAEEEVLLVLQHVARGMKHLRDNAVVHRDVKPGNILRCKDPDGRSVYKLTDFGAARELEDEEHFVSLYGTEEYLHPHIYERAVLRRSNSKLFDASVDLWSIGVTYYHMATGSLPFRPFGGRRNKELMHEIVSKKERGVISGVQSVENGAIQWSQTLPNTCQISSGLKMFLVPLLAALLEIKAEEIWPFEKYFETVDTICNKCIVDLFCPMQSRYIKIYLDPEEKLCSLQECVAMETKIKQENQVLLIDSQPLELMIDESLPIKNYPDYITYFNPILVFNKENKFSPYPDPVYIGESLPHPSIHPYLTCVHSTGYNFQQIVFNLDLWRCIQYGFLVI